MNNELNYSEKEQLLREVVLQNDSIVSNQTNFDIVIKSFSNDMISFRREFLYNTIKTQLVNFVSCVREKHIRNKINRFLRNSTVINETMTDFFEYTNFDDKHTKDIMNIRLLSYSTEKKILKALLKKHLITQQEIDREPLRYDREILHLIRECMRRFQFVKLVDTRLLTYMSKEERAIIRLNIKHQKRIDRQKQFDTNLLLKKLKLL